MKIDASNPPRHDVTPTSSTIPTELRAKEAQLVAWLRARGSVLVGFSGGVDSAYLACVALDALGADKMLAVIGRSASYPAAQWATARAVAERFGVPVFEVDTDEMNDPRYAANPINRCYFCKSELWTKLAPVAAARGLVTIVDGTNADDLRDHRPGAQAAREQAVSSPLAELGFSKSDIRALSQGRDIPTWAQPSSPCLSSRLPYGTAVTAERLAMVERAEAALRELGVQGDLRVRHFGAIGKVEIARAELEHWLAAPYRSQVEAAVRSAGFIDAEIDPKGFRSGALNVLAGVPGAG